MPTNFKTVPAEACSFKAEFVFGDNGENSKTVPVQLTARSGDPIDHPYWGRVVHDFNGMVLNKNRLPIDWNHEDEILGFLNHFDSSSGDLVCSGALTPFKADDRASEIIFKMKSGVPYESSINFGGDGIIVEEVPEATQVSINGRELIGPLTVIRQFPLRGVAICPYGADANTPAALLSDSKSQFSVQVIKGEIMSENTSVVEAEATVQPVVEAVAEPAVEAPVELAAVEVKTEEKKEEVAVEAVVESPAVEAAVVEEKPVELSAEREEFKAMVTEFGAELAATYFSSNVSLSQARADHYEALKNEVKTLRDELAQFKAQSNPSVSQTSKPVVGVELTDNKSSLNDSRIAELSAKGLSKGEAMFAASIKL